MSETSTKSGSSTSDKSSKSSDSGSGGSTSSKPKSASELSISHFSSVSSPAYKAGWESIFGKPKSNKKIAAKSANDDQIPDQLTIEDEDIKKELRDALYKAFQKQARKQGFSLAKVKKRVELSYTLKLDIEEK